MSTNPAPSSSSPRSRPPPLSDVPVASGGGSGPNLEASQNNSRVATPMNSIMSPRRRTAPLPGPAPAAEPLQDQAFRRVRLIRILVTTWFSYAAYCMARRPFSVIRATIADDIGLSVADCVVVDTAFLVMYTVGQLIYGPVQQITGLGARDLLFIGLAGSCASLAALTVSFSLWQCVVAWGFHGLVQAVGWSSCLLVVTPWLAVGERGTVMGVWGTMAAGGAVLGNVATPLLLDLTGSWRGAVLGVTVIMLGVDLLTRMFVARHPNAYGFVAPSQQQQGVTSLDVLTQPGALVSSEGEIVPPLAVADSTNTTTSAAEAAAAIARRRELPVSELIKRPGVVGLCASYFCMKLVRYVLSLWLPYYFTQVQGHSAQVAGVIASAFDVGGVVGSILSGYASDRYEHGQRRTEFVMWMCLATGGCLGGFSVGALFASNAYYIGVVTFFSGAFIYATESVMTGTLLQDFSERSQLNDSLGALSGLVGGIGTLGSVLEGPLTATVSAYSWPALFFVLQLIIGLAALALWAPWRLERAAQRSKTTPPAFSASDGASP